MLWQYGNGFIKRPAILALAGILHKNNYCNRTWGGLSSPIKLEPVKSKRKEILQINVLQKSSPISASEKYHECIRVIF